MNYHRIDEHYDFYSEYPSQINVASLSNQIIHSLVFEFPQDDNENPTRIDGFLVTSDRSKDDRLYHVSIKDYLAAIRLVGKDWVQSIHARRKMGKKGGWEISQR